MSLQPIHQTTFDDWLDAERARPDGRTEYVAGEIFAMAGGSEEHNLIVANVVGELRGQLKGKPCRVYPSDMKVRIAAANVGAYPDVMVICGERQFYDDHRDVVTNPHLLVEVVSDSTEGYDRGQKFAHYRQLESLQAYLLIAQDRVAVDLYLRQDDRTWNLQSFDELAAAIALPTIEARLAVAEVYDKVDTVIGHAS
jgi:Uma2 family endonuclease